MKLVRELHWRCSKCSNMNRLRTAMDTYEPTTYTCDKCGLPQLVESHDLVEAAGKVRVPKHRDYDEEPPG